MIYSRFNSSLASQRKMAWNGVYDPHTNAMHYPKITQPTHAKWEQLPVSDSVQADSQHQLTNGTSTSHSDSSNTIFKPVSNVVARNFLVTDTVYVSPSQSGVGIPGPDGDMLAMNHNGLPHMSDEILEELPAECRAALLEAKKEETEWKENWTTESRDGMRGNLKIGFLGFPV
jgi:chromatin structure-remodeling complex protein RSC7